MSENVIFCYSGTGNCLDIARTIGQHLGDTDIVMMRSEPAVTDVSGARRVGFVFPCYAGGLPGKVEEYVRQIQVGEDAYTFGIVSYAGYPGIGLSVIDSIIPLNYWTGISHQCSCIWLLPHTLMMPPVSPEKAQERAERLSRQAAAVILSGRRLEGHPTALAVNRAESKAWPVLSQKKAEKFAVSDACIGCGQCERLCPRGNIRLENGKPVFGTDCIQCLGCLQYCPKQAIHLGGVTKTRERYHNAKVTAKDLTEKIIHID